MKTFTRGAVWSTQMIALNVGNTILTTWVTFYATRTLGLDIGVIGILLLLSKVFDGITDLIAGYIIDRTRTKWGVARPYDLCIIGYWVSLILLFATPPFGDGGKLAYIFIMYFMCASVFSTLISCANPVYFNNSMPKGVNRITVLSVSASISGIVMFFVSVAFPSLVDRFCSTQKGWLILMTIIGIPLTLLALTRFALIKEQRSLVADKPVYGFGEGCRSLFGNRYILILAGAMILCNITNTVLATATPFFFENYIGDLSANSMFALSAASALILVMVSSPLCKKLGTANFVRMTLIVSACGFLLRLIAPSSAGLQFAAGLLVYFAPMPFWAIAPQMMIDCMDYGEWKTHLRVEGFISSVNGISSKLGIGIGSAIPSLLLGMTGFNAAAGTSQPEAARSMILAINTWIPAVLTILSVIFMFCYTLEKKLPQIKKELEQRREK